MSRHMKILIKVKVKPYRLQSLNFSPINPNLEVGVEMMSKSNTDYPKTMHVPNSGCQLSSVIQKLLVVVGEG